MNTDLAIIDANFARVREGFRVLDDSARFVLRSEILFTKIKKMRHDMAIFEYEWGRAHLVSARVGRDVGAGDLHARSSRHSLFSIVQANSRRVTEALRVLEEFALVYQFTSAKKFAEMRYIVYEIELEFLYQTPQYYLHKYFEEGIVYPLSDSVEEILWLAEHGAKIIQLREKNKVEAEVKLKRLCGIIGWMNKNQEDKILLILNDFPELAARYSVAGVHVGQDYGDTESIRRIIGSNKIIGRSNNSFEELSASAASGADYVSIGPVYATSTKPERMPVGLEVIQKAAEEIAVPWLAIGGIDEKNIAEVKLRGAKNVAVVRAAREFFS